MPSTVDPIAQLDSEVGKASDDLLTPQKPAPATATSTLDPVAPASPSATTPTNTARPEKGEALVVTPVVKRGELTATTALGSTLVKTLAKFDAFAKKELSSDITEKMKGKLYEPEDFAGFVYTADGHTTAGYVYLQLTPIHFVSLDTMNEVVEGHLTKGGPEPKTLEHFLSKAFVPRFNIFTVDGKVAEEMVLNEVRNLVTIIRQMALGESSVLPGINPLGKFSDLPIYLVGDKDDQVKAIVEKCAARFDSGAKILHLPQPDGITTATSYDTKIEKEAAAVKAAAKVEAAYCLWSNTVPGYRVWQAGDRGADRRPTNVLWDKPADADPAPKAKFEREASAFIKLAEKALPRQVENNVHKYPTKGQSSLYDSAEGAIGMSAQSYATMLAGKSVAGTYVWRRRCHPGQRDRPFIPDRPGNYLCMTKQSEAFIAYFDYYVQMLIGINTGDDIWVRTEFLPPRSREFPTEEQWWMRFAPDCVRIAVYEGTDIKTRVTVPCDMATAPSKWFNAYLTELCDDYAYDMFLLEYEATEIFRLNLKGEASTGPNLMPMDDRIKSAKVAAFGKLEERILAERAAKDKKQKEALAKQKEKSKADGEEVSPQATATADTAPTSKNPTATPFKGVAVAQAITPLQNETRDFFSPLDLAVVVNLPKIYNFQNMTLEQRTAFFIQARKADPEAESYFPDPEEGIAADERIIIADAVWHGRTCTLRSYLKFYPDGQIGSLSGLYPKSNSDEGESLVEGAAMMTDYRIVYMNLPARRSQLDVAGMMNLSNALQGLIPGLPDGITVQLVGGFPATDGYGDLALGDMPAALTGTVEFATPVSILGLMDLHKLELSVSLSDEVDMALTKVTPVKSYSFEADATLTLGEELIDLAVTFTGGKRDSPMFTATISDWIDPFGIGGFTLDEASLMIMLDPTVVHVAASMTIADRVKISLAGEYAKGAPHKTKFSASIAELTLTDICAVAAHLTRSDAITFDGDGTELLKFENISLLLSKGEKSFECTMIFDEKIKADALVKFSKADGIDVTGTVEGIELADGITLDLGVATKFPPGYTAGKPFVQGFCEFTIPGVDIGCKLLCRLGSAGKCAAAKITGFAMSKISPALAWMDFKFPELMFSYSDKDNLPLTVDGEEILCAQGFTIQGICMFEPLNKLFGGEVKMTFKLVIRKKKIGQILLQFLDNPATAVSPRIEKGSGPNIHVDPENGLLVVAFGSSVTVFGKQIGLEAGFQVAAGPPMGVNLFGRAIVADPGLRIGAESSTLALKQIGMAGQLLPVPGAVTLFGEINFGFAASAAVALRLHPTIIAQCAFMIQVENATFRDLLDVIPSMVGMDPLPKMPLEEEFKKLHMLQISVAPLDMPPLRFGDLVMKPGFCFAGDLEAFGNRAQMMIEVNKKGFLLDASLRDAVNVLGVLKVSSADGRAGPSVYLRIGKGVFELDLDGAIDILGQKLFARVVIRAPSSIKFDVGFVLLGISTRLQGEKNEDGSMYVCFELGDTQREKAKRMALEEVKKAVREVQEAAEQSVEDGAALIDAYNAGLQQLQENLETAKKELLEATELMATHSDAQLEILDQQQEEAERDVDDIELALVNNVAALQKEFEEALQNCRESVADLDASHARAQRLREAEEQTFADNMNTATSNFNRNFADVTGRADALQRTAEDAAESLQTLRDNEPPKCCNCSCKHKKRWKKRVKAADRENKNAQQSFATAEQIVKSTQAEWDERRQRMEDAHKEKHAELKATEDEQLDLLNVQKALLAKLTAVVDASQLGVKLAERKRAAEGFATLDRRFAEKKRVVEIASENSRKASVVQLSAAQANFRKLKLLLREGSYTPAQPMDEATMARAKQALTDLSTLTRAVKPHTKRILKAVDAVQGVLKEVGVRFAVLSSDASVQQLVPTREEAAALAESVSDELGTIVVTSTARVVPELCTFHSIAQERDLLVAALDFIKMPERFACCWIIDDDDAAAASADEEDEDAGGVGMYYEEFQLHYDAVEKSRQVSAFASARVVMDHRGKLFEEACAATDDTLRTSVIGHAYKQLGVGFVVASWPDDADSGTLETFIDMESAMDQIAEHNDAGVPFIVMDESGQAHPSLSNAPAEVERKLSEMVLISLGVDVVLTTGMTTGVDASTVADTDKAAALLRALPPTRSYLTVDTRGRIVPDCTSVRSEFMEDLLLDGGEKGFTEQYLLATAKDKDVEKFFYFKDALEASEAAAEAGKGDRVLVDIRGQIYDEGSSFRTFDGDNVVAKALEAVGVRYFFAWAKGDGTREFEQHDSYGAAFAAYTKHGNGAAATVMTDSLGNVYDSGTRLRRIGAEGNWGLPGDAGLVGSGENIYQNTVTRKKTFCSRFQATPSVWHGLVRVNCVDKDKTCDYNTDITKVTPLGFEYHTKATKNEPLCHNESMFMAFSEREGVVTGSILAQRTKTVTVKYGILKIKKTKKVVPCVIESKKGFTTKVYFPKGHGFTKPPTVVLGITGMKNTRQKNTRITTWVTEVTKDSFRVYVVSWSDSKTYRVNLRYAAIPADSATVQAGTCTHSRKNGNITAHNKYVTRVTFPTPYERAPRVALGLNGLDVCSGANTRLLTKVKNVDKEGFDFEVSSWFDTKIQGAKYTWIAQRDGAIAISEALSIKQNERVPLGTALEQDTLRFTVKGSQDVYLYFAATEDGFWEKERNGGNADYWLILGGWINTRTIMRRHKFVGSSHSSVGRVDVASADTPNILADDEHRPFWIQFDKASCELSWGTGIQTGLNEIGSCKHESSENPLRYVQLCTKHGSDASFAFEFTDRTMVKDAERDLYELAREQADEKFFVCVNNSNSGPALTHFATRAKAEEEAQKARVGGDVLGRVVMDIHGAIYPEHSQYLNDDAEEETLAHAARLGLELDYRVLTEGASEIVAERHDSVHGALEEIAKLPDGASYMVMTSVGQRMEEASYFADRDWEELLWRKTLQTLQAGLVLTWRDFHKIREERFYNFAFDDAYDAAMKLPEATNRILMDTFGNVLENASAFSNGQVVNFECHPSRAGGGTVTGRKGLGMFPFNPIMKQRNLKADVRFKERFETVPQVFHGLTTIDCDDARRNTSVRTDVLKITPQGYVWRVGAEKNAKAWRVGHNYLATTNPELQVGAAELDYGLKSRKGTNASKEVFVKFAKRFDAPPQVNVGLTGLEVPRDSNTRLRVTATDITRDGFKVCAKTSDGSDVDTLGICYAAHDEEASAVQSGTARVGSFPKKPIKKKNSQSVRVKFPTKFETPPKVCAVINDLDVDSGQSTRLDIDVKDVDETGFTIVAKSWRDTCVWSVNVTWVAVAEFADGAAYAEHKLTELHQTDMIFSVRGESDACMVLGNGDPSDAVYEVLLKPASENKIVLRRKADNRWLGEYTPPGKFAAAQVLSPEKFTTYWFARDPGNDGRFTIGQGEVVGRDVLIAYEPENEKEGAVPLSTVYVAQGVAAKPQNRKPLGKPLGKVVSKGTKSSQWQFSVHEGKTNGFICATDKQYGYDTFNGRVRGDTVRFSVKAAKDVYVAMNTDDDSKKPLYEVAIGINDNNDCELRQGAGEKAKVLDHEEAQFLSNTEYTEFWMKFDRARRRLSIGEGAQVGLGEFLSTTVAAAKCPFQHVFISTGNGATGDWCFRSDNVAFLTQPGCDYSNKVVATQPGQNRVRLHIKARKDVFIGLALEMDPKQVLYELVIAPGGKNFIQLRDSRGQKEWSRHISDVADLPAPLDPEHGDDFWITWDPATKRLHAGSGRQAGQNELIECQTDTSEAPLRYLFLTAAVDEAEWELLDDQEYLRSRAESIIRTDASYDGKEFFALDKPVAAALRHAERLAREPAKAQLDAARKKPLPAAPAKAEKAFVAAQERRRRQPPRQPPRPRGRRHPRHIRVRLRRSRVSWRRRRRRRGVSRRGGGGVAKKREKRVTRKGEVTEHATVADAEAYAAGLPKNRDCIVFTEDLCVLGASRAPDMHDVLYSEALRHLGKAGAFRYGELDSSTGDVKVTLHDTRGACNLSDKAHVLLGPGNKVLAKQGSWAEVDEILKAVLLPDTFYSFDLGGVHVQRFGTYAEASEYYHTKMDGLEDRIVVGSRGGAVLSKASSPETLLMLKAAAAEKVGGSFLLCSERADNTYHVEHFVSYAKALARAAAVPPAVANLVLIDSYGEYYASASRNALPLDKRATQHQACLHHARSAVGVGVVFAYAKPDSGLCYNEQYDGHDIADALKAADKLQDEGCKGVLVDSLGSQLFTFGNPRRSIHRRLVDHAHMAIAASGRFQRAKQWAKARAFAEDMSDTLTQAVPEGQQRPAVKGITAELRKDAADLLAAVLGDSRVLSEVDDRILDFEAVAQEVLPLGAGDFCSDVAELHRSIKRNQYDHKAAHAFQQRASQVDLLTSLSADIFTAAVNSATKWSEREDEAFLRMKTNIASLHELLSDPRFDAPAQRDPFVVECRHLRETVARLRFLYPTSRPYIERLQKQFDKKGLTAAVRGIAAEFENNEIREIEVMNAMAKAGRVMMKLGVDGKRAVVSEKQIEAARARIETLRQQLQKQYAAANTARRGIAKKKTTLRSKYTSDLARLQTEVAEEKKKLAAAADVLRDFLAASYEQEDVVEEQQELIAELQSETTVALTGIQNFAQDLAPSEKAVADAETELAEFKESPLARAVNQGTAAMQRSADNAAAAGKIYEQMISKSAFSLGYIKAEASFSPGGSAGLELEFKFTIDLDFSLRIDLGILGDLNININLPKFSLTLNFGVILNFIKNIAKTIFEEIKKAFS